MRMTAGTWGMLLALSVLWGGSFFFVEIIVAAIPPLMLVWLRVALAALALLVFLRLTGRSLPMTRAAWVAFLGMGLLNNVVPFSLIAWGQTEIASGLASIINAMTPVSAVVLAHFLTADEALTPGRITGVLMGLAGVVVLIGVEALEGIGVAVVAQIAVLAATISYGFAGIWGRRFKRLGIEPTVAAAGQVTGSTLLLAIPAFVVAPPWALPMPSLAVVFSILGLAVLSTALAYVLFFRILAAAGAGNVMLVTLLVPPSAILLGWGFLDETLEARQIAGMALIGLGLLWLDGRAIGWLTARRPG
ncbi:MAG: DMT family transporter [Pseudomonadota bacterium]